MSQVVDLAALEPLLVQDVQVRMISGLIQTPHLAGPGGALNCIGKVTCRPARPLSRSTSHSLPDWVATSTRRPLIAGTKHGSSNGNRQTNEPVAPSNRSNSCRRASTAMMSAPA
jgi:hypothetical protein